MRHLIHHLGDLAVDVAGLFLGYPEIDGKPRRSVREAVLYLAILGAFVTVAILWG